MVVYQNLLKSNPIMFKNENISFLFMFLSLTTDTYMHHMQKMGGYVVNGWFIHEHDCQVSRVGYGSN